ncbi:metallophosphoesterase [Shewanella amazonensis]|uniref:Phosphoesterase, related to the Icc protein n=1 Tax=Shewanella amazonensis (strain ATCC BAA-1098 / SB2B) TaxID=326297 RepID=A1S2B3_SHEAM|nr:metallophosphoesterase [Shewanella amazonensis]ABL98519.1 phosphoesterase, related to the Icc protein [Shewanella amazonensis SB2B]
MNIRLYSDLHIEFEDFHAPADGADVVVLAGDVDVGVRGIDWIVRQEFSCPVIYVMGNHEYYNHRYPSLLGKVKQHAAGKNIHILENESVEIDGVRFHGATLWADFKLFGDPRVAGYECQQVMRDYKKIRKEPSYSKLRSIDVASIHNQSLSWLAESLASSKSSVNVVVTHHAPSMLSVPAYYQDNLVTAAYASDLSAFIDEHKPDYWLHGHLHTSSNYYLGACQVLANPKGYKGEVNESFDPSFSLTLAKRGV